MQFFITAPWINRAACRHLGAELFFLEKHSEGNRNPPALKVCAHCPVKKECLDYAITTNEQFGIWGGMSPKQRHVERRNRRA